MLLRDASHQLLELARAWNVAELRTKCQALAEAARALLAFVPKTTFQENLTAVWPRLEELGWTSTEIEALKLFSDGASDDRVILYDHQSVVLVWLGLAARPSWAVYTASGFVGAAPIQVLPAHDLVNNAGLPMSRAYFMIQNPGTTNPMNVAIGTNNNATAHDMVLQPGSTWVTTEQGQRALPDGDVSVVSQAGTSYSVCDW